MIIFTLCAGVSFSCDSAILALLTGKDSNSVFVTRLLAISQRLQLEGEALNGFNIAAAKKQHKEILEAWLYTVSEAYTSIEVPKDYAGEYSRLLIEVAKDLGQIRKKLSADSLELIHEIIEACITKISLIGAIVSQQFKVYEFLKLELAIFEPRCFIKDFEKFTKMTGFEGFKSKMEKVLNGSSEKQRVISEQLFEKIEYFKKRLGSSGKVEGKCLTDYIALVDTFILLKKQILEERILEI